MIATELPFDLRPVPLTPFEELICPCMEVVRDEDYEFYTIRKTLLRFCKENFPTQTEVDDYNALSERDRAQYLLDLAKWLIQKKIGWETIFRFRVFWLVHVYCRCYDGIFYKEFYNSLIPENLPQNTQYHVLRHFTHGKSNKWAYIARNKWLFQSKGFDRMFSEIFHNGGDQNSDPNAMNEYNAMTEQDRARVLLQALANFDIPADHSIGKILQHPVFSVVHKYYNTDGEFAGDYVLK